MLFQSQLKERGQYRMVGTYAVATMTACLILSLHFFVSPLRPLPDQGWMLQAAIRQSRGEGLTTQMNGESLDLANPDFSRLVYFPPGYPTLISAMLRAGFDVEMSVKVVSAVALLTGVVGWLVLALPLLRKRALRLLYCTLLVLTCGGIIVKGGTTDLIFWAGVPWWVLCLARARLEQGGSRNRLMSVAGIIAAILITVRWSALFFAPTAIAAIAIPLRRRIRDLIGTAVAATLVALPTIAVYFGLGAINRHHMPNANFLSFVKPGWHPQYLLTLYPFESLLTIPLGLASLLDRVWRSIDPTMNSLWGAGIFRVALPIMLVSSVVASARRARSIEPLPHITGSILLVVAVVSLALIAFLAWMALRYNWDFVDWSFLSEPRYYRPFLPAFLLGWLVLFDRFTPAPLLWRTGVALLAFSGIYLSQAAARAEWSALRTHDESLEIVAKVRGLTANPGLNLVFDIDISDYIIHPEPNLLASNYVSETDVPRVYVSQPATLWLVRRVSETTAYLLDRNRDQRAFEAFRDRFGLTLNWRSTRGNYEIWAAPVP